MASRVSQNYVRVVGRSVRAYRESQGLSQRDLANLVGVGAATINRIENGTHRTTMENLYNIANALGCRLEAFYEDDYQDDMELTLTLSPLKRVFLKYWDFYGDEIMAPYIKLFMQIMEVGNGNKEN